MPYLQPADYPNYGLPPGTTADWITAATALINSYCRRPDLNVVQYTERLRVTRGARTALLSYLPLAPLGTAGFSTVKPNFAWSFSIGAEAPKLCITTFAPLAPT